MRNNKSSFSGMKNICLLQHYHNWIFEIFISDLTDCVPKICRKITSLCILKSRSKSLHVAARLMSIKKSTFDPSYHRSLIPPALHSHLLRKFPITFIVEVTGKDQTASHSPTGLPRMLAPRFVSDSRIQLPFSSPWREYGRREDRKGKVK